MNSLQTEAVEKFKATLPKTETSIADWDLYSVGKGGALGKLCVLLLTDKSLHKLRLDKSKRNAYEHKKFNLLDIENIHHGYLSHNDAAVLDELEENLGHYALRIHIGNEKKLTFQCADQTEPDEMQKVRMEVITSSIKAARRELYFHNRKLEGLTSHFTPPSSPVLTSPLQAPTTLNGPKKIPDLPAEGEGGDPYLYTSKASLITDAGVQVDGTLTVTPKHFVFEPADREVLIAEFEEGIPFATNIPQTINLSLEGLQECKVLDKNSEILKHTKFDNAKVLELLMEKRNFYFAVHEQKAEIIRSRVSQWVQLAQDEALQKLLSTTVADSIPAKSEEPVDEDGNSTVFIDQSDILSPADMRNLYKILPEKHEYDQWKLAYGTTKHGISINTFYTKIRAKAPTILIVQDEKYHVFGGYVADIWQTNKKGHYGSGETFLFKLNPDLKVYKWTKLNDYFMLNDKDSIALGGGGTGFGLWLDSDFYHGTSVTCDTFLNDPLASTIDFKVLRFEAWVLS